MSFMDKLRSWFGGGSPDAADAHGGHDRSAHDHSAHDMTEPAAPPAPPVPPADPIGMPTSAPAASDDEEDRPA